MDTETFKALSAIRDELNKILKKHLNSTEYDSDLYDFLNKFEYCPTTRITNAEVFKLLPSNLTLIAANKHLIRKYPMVFKRLTRIKGRTERVFIGLKLKDSYEN